MDYTNLLQMAISNANNNGADFVINLPNIIELAQQAIWRELDDLGFENITVLTDRMVINDPFIAKPNDYLSTVSVFIGNEVSPYLDTKLLYLRAFEFCIQYYKNINISSADNPPLFYAEHQEIPAENGIGGLSHWFICPPPDKQYFYNITYKKKVVALSDDHPNNILTDEYFDLLFYGTMIRVFDFLDNSERKASFEPQYQAALQSAIAQSKGRYTDRTQIRDKS